ncbi:MAG: peptide-methionine (S)-S-oxide reductase MsrA [bacterium]|nr:peptide-methionine (S)-S-oxide reductase MsrA [bacterium]
MTETATLAGGCFWCTEAIYKRIKGVISVESGFAGGTRENPSYQQVITDATGHAETIQIIFDPSLISYESILEIFWHMHDPTTLNQQGADRGTHYRSVIFYHNERQHHAAEKSKQMIEKNGVYKDPIVTEILPFKAFYKAEDYHQDYYEQNKDKNMYCQIVIDPKIQKLIKEFKEQLKT